MSVQELPAGYELADAVDLRGDPAYAKRIGLFSLVLAALMTIAALPIVPLSNFVPIHAPRLADAVRLLLLLPGIFLYRFLHEAIHALLFRRLGKTKSILRFVGIRLSAGSRAYFDRRSYLIILTSPIAVLGVILLTLHSVLPRPWFWFFYILQIVNLAGAAGDLFLAAQLQRMPHTVLIRDDGEKVELYLRTEKAGR